MKYLKKFEYVFSISDDPVERPQVGDWVLIKSDFSGYERLNKYLDKTPGKLISIIDGMDFPYNVSYNLDTMPVEVLSDFSKLSDKHYISFNEHEIFYWSDDIEELMMILDINKYNL
jgi:hypothetical protein